MSVSTIVPPHAIDGFKTDSAPFRPHFIFLVQTVHVNVIVSASLSWIFYSIWPPVAVNVLYFQVHSIDDLGGAIVETLI